MPKNEARPQKQIKSMEELVAQNADTTFTREEFESALNAVFPKPMEIKDELAQNKT